MTTLTIPIASCDLQPGDLVDLPPFSVPRGPDPVSPAPGRYVVATVDPVGDDHVDVTLVGDRGTLRFRAETPVTVLERDPDAPALLLGHSPGAFRIAEELENAMVVASSLARKETSGAQAGMTFALGRAEGLAQALRILMVDRWIGHPLEPRPPEVRDLIDYARDRRLTGGRS